MILLDTHVLIWLAEDHPKLGRTAAALVDRALHDDALCVSAFSFWELAMLVVKRRLQIADTPEVIRRKTLEQGLREVPLTGDVGVAAASLIGFHGDPADRIIAATAISTGATLFTADRRMLAWRGGLKSRDARR